MQEYVVNIVNPNDWNDIKFDMLLRSNEDFKALTELSHAVKTSLKQSILGQGFKSEEQIQLCELVEQNSVVIYLDDGSEEVFNQPPVFTPPVNQESVALKTLPSELQINGINNLEEFPSDEGLPALGLAELLKKRDEAFSFIFKVDEMIASQLDGKIQGLNDQMEKISQSISQLEGVKSRLVTSNLEQFRLQESDTNLEEELNDINQVMNDLIFVATD